MSWESLVIDSLPQPETAVNTEMKLSEFINTYEEAIIGEWESFAETLLPAANGMTRVELRDHAQKILAAPTQPYWP